MNDEAKNSAEANHNLKGTSSDELDDNTNQKSSEQHKQQWEITREEKGSRGSNTYHRDNAEPGKMSSSETAINSEKTDEDPDKTEVENPAALSEKYSDDKRIENPVLSEKSSDDKAIKTPVPSEKSSDDKGIETPVPSEKSSDDKGIENPGARPEKSSDEKGIENPVLSEKPNDDKGVENPVVVSEIDLPSFVVTPASPDQELLGNLDTNKDKEGTDNPVFEVDE